MTPLPPDRWPEIERLFALAVGRPVAEADTLLGSAEPAVAAEVRAMLDADRAADRDEAGLLDAPPSRLLATLFSRADLRAYGTGDGEPAGDLTPGTRVGPWAIEDEIGWGGMGVVYRARRADGLHREAVALKVVKRGMDSAAVVRRFAQERALLAGLDHPGIARLIDGGTAPDGRPYFALELVDGEPITSAADRRRLSVEDRVRLFLQVCEAVAHAHRRLVVHRDLKPSNVLVTSGDTVGDAAGGRVKLLDFGVARLLDGASDGSAGGEGWTVTGDGFRPMTPEYAAPEQLDGGPVTTATDVYALGVLLYELLAGHRPHQAAGRPPAALAEAIRGAPPERPSAAAGQTRARRSAGAETRTVAPADIAAARATTPGRLRERLRGDLDAVVLRALRPEPEARFATVDALADDLRRHLAGRPVAARAGTARYVAGRFVRRNRWSVGVGALFVLFLAGALAVVAAQNRRAARERDRAEEIAALLESLFLDIDPGNPNGAPSTLRDVLDLGAARVEALDDSPDVQAHLLDVLARVYRAHADYDRALPLHLAAVRAAEEAHGPDAPQTLLARHHLAYLLEQMGRGGEAERIYRDVLAARRLSGDPDGLVESYSDLAALVLDAGRSAEAARLARAGLAVLDRHPDAGPPDLEGPLSRASFLYVLARTDEAHGRLGAAERGLRETVAIYTRARGPEHTYTAAAETSLGGLVARRGRHAAADSLLRHAVAVQTHTWGPAHPWTTGALTARAEARARAGDRDAARRLLAEARVRIGADSARLAALDRRERRIAELIELPGNR